MTAPTAQSVLTRLEHERILPVVTVEDPEQALHAATALQRAGLTCIEIALRTPAAIAAIQRIASSGELCVGAGTVLSVELARAALDAGARFAVAPGLREDVVRACSALGLPFFPGVATPTELEHAHALNIRTVKVFPAATVGGVPFLRAVSATYPDVRFIPTGGISRDSYADYLREPSVLAVAGSWLTPPALLREQRFGEIEQLARETLEGRP